MTLFNESLQISLAMKKCDGTPQKFIELPHEDTKNLKKIIYNNQEDFLDFIHKVGLNMEHSSLTRDTLYSEATIHTLKTTCFKVDFNDYFARISQLK